MHARRRWRCRLIVLSVATFTTACATRGFVLPTVPATLAENGPDAWAEATSACRTVRSYRAALGLSGRVGNRRIPGLASATLGLVATEAGDIALEARVSGHLLFILAGRAERLTLLLNDERRVVVAPAEDIVEALVGARLGPARLVSVLGGCASLARDAVRVERRGDVLAATTADSVVYLVRRGTWEVRAAEFDQILVDYTKGGGGLAKTIGVRTLPGRTPPVSLSLDVRSREANPVVDASVFAVALGEDVMPLSLSELRASGPLGEPASQ